MHTDYLYATHPRYFIQRGHSNCCIIISLFLFLDIRFSWWLHVFWPNVYPQHRHIPTAGGPESGLDASSTVKEPGRDLLWGSIPESTARFILSFRGWLRTKPKSVFHEAGMESHVLLWVLARVELCTSVGHLHSPSPSAALWDTSFCLSVVRWLLEHQKHVQEDPWVLLENPLYFPLVWVPLLSFLRDQFFKSDTPLFNHVLGWRVTECMCECHSTLSFFV